MNQITDTLWISDIQSVAESSTSGFDVVVSVCQDCVRDNVGTPYFQFPLADDAESQRNWGGTTEYSEFERAAWWVLWSVFGGGQTLVHCHRGRNRSAAVCTAVLAVREHRGYVSAFEDVREARPIADPASLMETHARRFIGNALESVTVERDWEDSSAYQDYS